MTLQTKIQALAAKKKIAPLTRWVLQVPFEYRALASQAGARWEGAHRCFIWSGETLPPTLEVFACLPYSWEWHQQKKLNPHISWNVEPLLPRWHAKPHQKTAQDLMIKSWKAKRAGFLLADKTGLGKTISSWSFITEVSSFQKILIVTSNPAQAHWRNTVRHYGDFGKEVFISNYDRLDKFFEVEELSSTRKKGKKKRVAKEGKAEVFDAIIWDESHKGKNLTAARSQMMIKLSAKAKFNVWASATAGQNPLELAYLMRLLAQVSGASLTEMKEFESWCKAADLGVSRGAYGKWEWRKSEESLKRINELLFGGKTPAGIRRTNNDIQGWREMERQMLPQTLDPKSRMLYQQAWADFKNHLLENKDIRAKQGKAKPANALVEQLRFRQKSSLLRIDSTLEQALDLLENGQHVAISVVFHETLETMAKILRDNGLDPAVCHGKMSAQEHEKQRLRFQREETPIVLFTTTESISLHQGEYPEGVTPRTMLVHDLKWSAIEMTQTEGRCHRDGQFSPTLWMFAEDTVEERIASVLLDKMIVMGTMQGDDLSTLKELEAMLTDEAARR